ncbi:MAG: response regulator [Herbinix sp.]|jgi:two-component system response regulator YesN|nr:response regulator [Herbinix sp.]
MLKVLIADDEQIICLMICKLIHWEAKGLEVIGMAHNGLEVLKMMEEQRPDIIISDIRMPGYDGLQLVQKGKDMGLDADFVIMSGYKNFEYAHTALNLGVKHYLLKPIDKKELEETIDRILQHRKEASAIDDEKKELEEIASSGKKRIRKHFLSTIIHHNHFSEDRELAELDEKFHCEFENGYFIAFLTKIDSNAPNYDTKSLLNGIDYLIEKAMEEGEWEYINSYVKTGVVTVVNYKAEHREQVFQVIDKILKLCRLELDKFNGFYVTIGIGVEKNSITGTKDTIREAVAAIKCRIKKGTNRIIDYRELNYRQIKVEDIFTEGIKRQFENELEAMDIQAFISDFDKIANDVHMMVNYSPVLIFELMEKLKEITIDIWKRNKIQENIINDFEQQMQFILDCNIREELLLRNFIETYQRYFERVIDDKRNTSQLPIRKAKQFINENYMRQITLEEVAEAIELSPAYFSTVFKKEIGINFSDYLISCRIESAKDKLKNGNLPVNLIAEEVGYVDAKYFSKTFYKLVGLKPTEYRKLYR